MYLPAGPAAVPRGLGGSPLLALCSHDCCEVVVFILSMRIAVSMSGAAAMLLRTWGWRRRKKDAREDELGRSAIGRGALCDACWLACSAANQSAPGKDPENRPCSHPNVDPLVAR